MKKGGEYIDAIYCVHIAAAYISYCHCKQNLGVNAFVNELNRERKEKKLRPVNHHQVSAGLMIIELNRGIQSGHPLNTSSIIAIPHPFVQKQAATLWVNYSSLSTHQKQKLMNELKESFNGMHLSILEQESDEASQ